MNGNRNIREEVRLNAVEEIALQHEANENGLSKSSMLRFAFLRYLEQKHHRDWGACPDTGSITE